MSTVDESPGLRGSKKLKKRNKKRRTSSGHFAGSPVLGCTALPRSTTAEQDATPIGSTGKGSQVVSPASDDAYDAHDGAEKARKNIRQPLLPDATLQQPQGTSPTTFFQPQENAVSSLFAGRSGSDIADEQTGLTAKENGKAKEFVVPNAADVSQKRSSWWSWDKLLRRTCATSMACLLAGSIVAGQVAFYRVLFDRLREAHGGGAVVPALDLAGDLPFDLDHGSYSNAVDPSTAPARGPSSSSTSDSTSRASGPCFFEKCFGLFESDEQEDNRKLTSEIHKMKAELDELKAEKNAKLKELKSAAKAQGAKAKAASKAEQKVADEIETLKKLDAAKKAEAKKLQQELEKVNEELATAEREAKAAEEGNR
ncbi:unnamed protein product [Amoebophrya sp. A25]|nr:unnamed protein product [Amoebophrya sp. A25]|eukprot:GSA25T00018636001.1